MKTHRLVARVSSDALGTVRPALEKWVGATGSVRRDGDELLVEAEIRGESARDLNRELLTSLRRVEKRTRLRSEWTHEGVCERFFDYVPKGTRTATDNAAARPHP